MTNTFSKLSLAIIFIAILARLLGIIEYPLHDPTEARYAEIPRLIIETGNWIMPPFDYGVPFWGKPPLTFWLTAISFKLFGYSEFAARLPVFL
ncbi:MAG: glycosyltransferase family 39 protein, partial [Thiotrichaceae bacterium]|nr:glycosyltransferase family 39 protein [Thiotrichaceae bacterium]